MFQFPYQTKWVPQGGQGKRVAGVPTSLLPSSHIDSISWELQSLLIKPVQRVLKYPLLLEKLLKATPPSHPDQRRLLQALEAAQQVAQDINEFKRRKDLGKGYDMAHCVCVCVKVTAPPLSSPIPPPPIPPLYQLRSIPVVRGGQL